MNYQIEDFKQLMLVERDTGDEINPTENFMILHVKDRFFAQSQFFEEPVESATRKSYFFNNSLLGFAHLKLVNKNLYYVEKQRRRKLYRINIFDYPAVEEMLCYETEGDIIYFEASNLEDVLYVFEINTTGDSLKLSVVKKEKNKFHLFREFMFDEGEGFPLNFEGRNMFNQH